MPNLKELTTKIGSGSTPRGGKSAYIDSGIPIIRSQNIIDLSFHESGLAFISEEQAQAMEGVSVHLNDVLLNITGDSTARVAIWNRRQQARVNQHVAIIRANPDQLDPYWLMYWLYSPEVKQHLLMLASSGASRAALTKGMLEQLELPDFSVRQQQSISAPLRALDDRIAANDRLTVIALMLQRSYWTKTVGELTKVTLSKVSNPILGGTPKRSDEALWEGNNLWASVADMTKAPHSHLVDTAEKISDEAIQTRRFSPLPAGSVLMSARGTVGRIVSTTKPTSFNQSAYGFVPPEGCGPALRLALLDVVAELESKSYGSVFSTITKQQINECTVPDVFNPQFDELHTLLNTLESRIIAAELENQALARTRDELLPLLMSGRITVGEAEEAADVAGTAASES